MTDTYILAVGAAIILTIAIVGIVIFLMLKKDHRISLNIIFFFLLIFCIVKVVRIKLAFTGAYPHHPLIVFFGPPVIGIHERGFTCA